MATRSELAAVEAGLDELLARVTALVELEPDASSREEALDLVAVERGLASTLRRLRRLTARLND